MGSAAFPSVPTNPATLGGAANMERIMFCLPPPTHTCARGAGCLGGQGGRSGHRQVGQPDAGCEEERPARPT